MLALYGLILLFLFDTSTLSFIYAPQVNAAVLPKVLLLEDKSASCWVNIRELSPVSCFVCK